MARKSYSSRIAFGSLIVGAIMMLAASPGRAGESANGANFTGTWGTTEGEMSLTQNGADVSGTYTQDNGRISGRIQGTHLLGYWAENGSNQRCNEERMGTYYWGRIDWNLTADNRFEGRWAYCDAAPTSASWTGDRRAVAANFNGTWGTSEGDMTLRQNGADVAGTYTQDNGRISGNVQGTHLLGYWAENGSNQRCNEERLGTYYWGRIDWNMTPDGNRFEGRWAYCDAAPTATPWTGDRRSR